MKTHPLKSWKIQSNIFVRFTEKGGILCHFCYKNILLLIGFIGVLTKCFCKLF